MIAIQKYFLIFVLLMNNFVSANETIIASESCGTSPYGIVHKRTTVGGIIFFHLNRVNLYSMIPLTTQEFIKRAIKKHNGLYDYSKSIYTKSNDKIIIICPEHGEFKQHPSSHLYGNGCPKCCHNTKLTTEEFIERATKKHNGLYDYSKSVYEGRSKKLIIICNEHGEFKKQPSHHLQGQGCPKCSKKYKPTTQEFIEKASKKHNNFYNYSKSVYVSAHNKIIIICPEHGEFKQEANNHLYGQGCPKCSAAKQGIILRKTNESFIERATKKHNGFYDYSKSVYINAHSEIIIICPEHGEFKQEANHHLNGSGCSKCSEQYQPTTEEFIERATKKHNGFYDYSKSVYGGIHKKLIIICPKHGEFKQNAGHHLKGSGCSKCVGFISKIESRWLDFLSVPNRFRQKSIRINGKFFRTDALDIKNRIIWEFYGDFWHGNLQVFNPNKINTVTKCTFAELNSRTMDREKFLIDNGYKVISIWESDFRKLENK